MIFIFQKEFSRNQFDIFSKSIDEYTVDEVVSSAAASVSSVAITGQAPLIPQLITGDVIDDSQLIKQSCHDSGIDIRDPNAILPGVQTKKNYSDADIVLSSDWVPPITIAATDFTDSPPRIQGSILNAENPVVRKKTSSVSFSVDDNSEHHSSTSSDKSNDNKRNKMLKRLSYPLTWVEGLTGEGKAPNESTESAPNTGDSNQSVFSKVFSR